MIGSGFTGLASALELLDLGCEVEVFEKESQIGGLAGGFKEESWGCNLEYFYHHIFKNDYEAIDLAKKVGCKLTFYRPKTSSYLSGRIKDLDSAISVLKFDGISKIARIRMGLGLAFLKMIPNGLFLEKYKTVSCLPLFIGKEAYRKVWGKLLTAKFGPYVDKVNMAWFWSRVAKRTSQLGYFEGGFANFAEKISIEIKKRGGIIFLNKEFDFRDKNLKNYDKVIVTVPASVAEKITNKKVMPRINYLSAQTLVLILKKSLMKKYWLNVLEDGWPFLVVVEQTRLINKAKYGNSHIVYLGNYLPADNGQLRKSKEEIIDEYYDYLRNVNPKFKLSWLKNSYLFRAKYAQPVFPTNYSTKIKNINKRGSKIWYANMSMVYPYDRGVNYAIEIGRRVAKECLT